ncbi:MAG: outer membrane protein transport protein [Gammaproteobacteria bacterium]
MAVNRKLSQITLLAGTSLAMLASTGLAYGSGFELQEQSASGMGNAFAGGAAIAQDASTIYTNPAGMVRLPGWQTSVATSLICPSFKLLDDKSQSQPAAGQALGGTGGDAGSCAAVPALYLSVPASERLWAGVGVNAPFGLETDYHPDWLGRFQAIESKVETVNINPALAFRLNDHVALGFGISWQYIDAKLTSQVNYGGAVLQGVEQGVANGDIPPSAVPDLFASALGLESAAKIKGNDSTWGWNIGALITLNPETRIGLQYRSKIDYKVSGTASFNNPPLGPLPPLVEPYGDAVTSAINNGLLASGPVTLKLELPESANFSVVRDLDTRWQVMADVQYTGWSSVEAPDDREGGQLGTDQYARELP